MTTSRITHATPAPLYASTPERMWEDDSVLPQQARDEGCKDIAEQLLGPTGTNLNVSLIKTYLNRRNQQMYHVYCCGA